ncbi:uncharacterized protein CTRU02_214042 [Colletotrichum truncatum]|uniref:Uncharacterized protein n=1 Tax=Colletotrichum truncatum TaxID=5467 RepID=A0ACC3YJD7_COLTU|nr:uncharacterized protein CTRU02_06353 [Colletotrichum truncatum]KAF6792857.1 hypothetical protein CTRU02_06353 [Colletotrichum truncatum]
MISHYFSVILLALSPIISTISAQPAQPVRPFANNNAYAVETEVDETGNKWLFKVWADGYVKKDKEGKLQPVDTVMVNKVSKRLTVVQAMNGLDPTKPHLKMRQVLKECWTMAGLEPSELKEVLGYKIENENMQTALTDCRTLIGIKFDASFKVSSTDTDEAKKSCWDALGNTIFSKSIRGAIADFDLNKELIQIEVDYDSDNTGAWDFIYYQFS